MMRVLMVTGAYWPEISGGGLQCKTIVDAFGPEIECVVLTTCTTKGPLPIERIGKAIVYRVFVDPSKYGWRIRALWQFVSQWWRIRKQIDILHLHGTTIKTLILTIWAKWMGIPVIQKMTSAGDDDPISIRLKRWGSWRIRIWSKADRFVSVSLALTKSYSEAGLEDGRLAEIPNAIDRNRFRPPKDKNEKMEIRKKLGLPLDKFIVLSVGFISYVKGTDILLDWFETISEKFRNLIGRNDYLIIIGSTDSRYFEVSEKLIKRIENLSSNDNFLHIKKALNIEEYYRAADRFTLPSRREGMSNALLEAAASGLTCYDHREKINVTLENCSIEVVTKQYLELYQNIMEDKQHARFNYRRSWLYWPSYD